jgi:ABC-type uncharacterized transport system ATPase subunit
LQTVAGINEAQKGNIVFLGEKLKVSNPADALNKRIVYLWI